MTTKTWHPGASIDVLRQSAMLRRCIHKFMDEQNVLEVITPVLSAAATTDPNIHSFRVGDYYLHTSPEFPMKRLLAAYKTDIYQIATVFRDGEAGRFHNAEFSLLEWYRVGFNHESLMDDVSELLEEVVTLFGMNCQRPKTIQYTDAVMQVCGVPFAEIDVTDIERVFSQHSRSYPNAIGNDLDAAMDLLMDEFVVSGFSDEHATFVVGYPASQAALARIVTGKNNVPVAERFEMYWGSVELANGFHELSDAAEQRARFEHDQHLRAQRGQLAVPMDEQLLEALSFGLPDCAGVALGLDRLMLILCGANHIDNVLAFSSSRA